MKSVRTIQALCGALLLGATTFCSAATVKSVRVWSGPDSTRVVFELSAPVEHRVFALADPNRIVIDLPDTKAAGPLSLPEPKGVVAQVRASGRTGGDLRVVLEIASVARLCASTRPSPELDALKAVWLVPPAERLADPRIVGDHDEQFHATLVRAAGNDEMARVHWDVTERIRIIRRLDFTKQPRIDATYDEHAKILKAIRANRGDQAAMLLRAHIETSQSEVRKITLHQVHMARHAGRSQPR